MSNQFGEELAGLLGDYTSLNTWLRTLDYTPPSGVSNKISVHLHYPAFHGGKVALSGFVTEITKFLIAFCLPNEELTRVKRQFSKKQINKSEYEFRLQKLLKKAKGLFIQAKAESDRTGESGELLLFILIEWILEAPQILAKMSLKTNSEMPVHGADAVHCKYIETTDFLYLYYGESKLYKTVSDALSKAIDSIAESLDPNKLKHELDLVCWRIRETGLSETTQERLRSFLNPFEDNPKHTETMIACLLAFEFSKYKHLPPDRAEEKFQRDAKNFLDKKLRQIEEKFKAKGIATPLEIFFLPLPSVTEFRELFRKEIGRKS